jgi:hypothetical protein
MKREEYTLIVCINGQRNRSMSSSGGEYGVTCNGFSIPASGGVIVTKVLLSNLSNGHPEVGHLRLVVAVRR